MRPTDTECPVCGTIFKQPIRPQGGGRRTIYCSTRCTSLDWVRGHGKQRKAAILKYDNRPENKDKKRERTRRSQLKKYGLTEADFEALLLRQGSRCAGCERVIDRFSARIDHCHETNRVRGLLCDQCNWALGMVKDNRQRLYQLAAYLELDRAKPVVYLIGSLRNPRVVEVGNDIRSLGMEVIDNWAAAGEFADDAWQAYSNARGRTYREALASREAQHIFYFDRAYLNLSDAAVMLCPAGKSAHLEFGYVTSRGKRGFMLMEDAPERYDVMLQFSDSPLFHCRKTLLQELQSSLLGDAAYVPSIPGIGRDLTPWNSDR